jgi:hypothetical protein
MSLEKVRKVRKARRVDLHCTLSFSSGEMEGEAAVLNISPAGCRAESDINLAEGLEFQTLIHLANQSRPIKVERASVRWVSGNAFGLSFILMLASERARLREFLEEAK